MLTQNSFFPKTFGNSFNFSFSRCFSASNQMEVDKKLKEMQTNSWDQTFDALVKNIVKELEPNNFDQIMAAPEPEFEEIFSGVSNEKFNSEVFMASLMESIAKLTSKVKIPKKYANAIALLSENHTEEEIEKAIKTVLPSVE